jgi:hypothetical protein
LDDIKWAYLVQILLQRLQRLALDAVVANNLVSLIDQQIYGVKGPFPLCENNLGERNGSCENSGKGNANVVLRINMPIYLFKTTEA